MSEHDTASCSLAGKSCKPCEGGIPAIDRQQAAKLLNELSGEWELSSNGKAITSDFRFKGFYKTIAFVNALAWVANNENHHPYLEIGYDHCLVKFTTHSIDGLSENDFICASRIDNLIA